MGLTSAVVAAALAFAGGGPVQQVSPLRADIAAPANPPDSTAAPRPRADDMRDELDALLAKRTRVYTAITARRMKALVEELGASAPIEMVDGTPSLRVTADGGRLFWVRMLGCPQTATAASPCRALQMFVLIEAGKRVGLDELNAFNTSYPFAKVTRLPSGMVTVEWSLTLDYGVTEGNLLLNLLIWNSMVDAFLEFLNGVSA